MIHLALSRTPLPVLDAIWAPPAYKQVSSRRHARHRSAPHCSAPQRLVYEFTHAALPKAGKENRAAYQADLSPA